MHGGGLEPLPGLTRGDPRFEDPLPRERRPCAPVPLAVGGRDDLVASCAPVVGARGRGGKEGLDGGFVGRTVSAVLLLHSVRGRICSRSAEPGRWDVRWDGLFGWRCHSGQVTSTL